MKSLIYTFLQCGGGYKSTFKQTATLDNMVIYLLGTSHIAKQSLKEVETAFETLNPDIIALELDQGRLQNLFSKPAKPRLGDMRHVGLQGFLFQLLGAWAEKRMGDVVGVRPGDEMRKAVLLASKHGKKIALIDQPIHITLRKLNKAITWREKFRFVKDIFSSKKKIPFDLRKVPPQQLIDELLQKAQKDYPSVYKVLVEERNHYMAKKLFLLAKKELQTTFLVIMGAGHLEGMQNLLSKTDLEVRNITGRI